MVGGLLWWSVGGRRRWWRHVALVLWRWLLERRLLLLSVIVVYPLVHPLGELQPKGRSGLIWKSGCSEGAGHPQGMLQTLQSRGCWLVLSLEPLIKERDQLA